MPEKLLFLTGRLAQPSLERVLAGMDERPFDYQVHDLGLKVAALMTADMIARRLPDVMGATRVVVPRCCAGALEALEERLGVPVERGPKALKDLPEFFGGKRRKADLSRYDIRIFAEIVEAPQLDVGAIVARAEDYRRDGADVIDIGCLPGEPFAHLVREVQVHDVIRLALGGGHAAVDVGGVHVVDGRNVKDGQQMQMRQAGIGQRPQMGHAVAIGNGKRLVLADKLLRHGGVHHAEVAHVQLVQHNIFWRGQHRLFDVSPAIRHKVSIGQ